MKNSILIICLSLFVNLSWSQCEDFEMTLTAHHPTCTDYTDGRVEIIISGGTGEVLVSIHDAFGDEYAAVPGGTENILGDGCYFVTATDELGCEIVDSVCLVDPLSITADIVISDPSFPGACDGEVSAESVAGYQGPFDLIVYTWTIPDAIDESAVTAVCAGEYTLYINDINGCTGIFDFALGSLVEIPLNGNQEIAVFVNRTNGELSIKKSAGNNLNIKVLNLAGQTVFESTINGNTASYSPNLNKGIYVYTVESKQGIIQTGKLVF